MAGSRGALKIIIIVFILYWGFLPAFWSGMVPRASAEIESEWDHNRDMPLTIRVSSMHSNFRISNVRFYINNQETKLEGVNVPLYAFSLYRQDKVQTWNRFTLNRFTFPRIRKLEVTVPFVSMKSEGKSGPGVISGTLDVEIDHVGSVHRYSGLAGQELSMENYQKIPFEIRLR